LIYCSITGFGQTGPYAERAGYDLMIQAMSGMMSITGRADGEPGGGPQRAGVAITDVFTGIYATSAILAAIEMRHRTGEGQHIDMALLDVGMAILANQAAGFINTGAEPQRMGNAHPSLVPYQDFPTADGAMLLAIGNDGQFARFCAAAGRPEWAQDTRFTTNTRRVENRSTLIPLMMEVTRTRTTAEWIALLEDKAVPCGPINTLASAFADPQVQARGLVQKQAVAPVNSTGVAPENIATGAAKGAAEIRTVASPMRLSAAPVQLRYAPPALGEHTTEVLRELGLDAARIQTLQQQGIV
jgi:formyl-CoA transferase